MKSAARSVHVPRPLSLSRAHPSAAGDFDLGRFHLSLGLHLSAAASMDVASAYMTDSRVGEDKKRIFWSLQLLLYYHGWCPSHNAVNLDQIWHACQASDSDRDRRTPPAIPNAHNDPNSTEPGIWNSLIQLASVWSRARCFVASCIKDEIQEPWRADSMYTKVLADLMGVEGASPMCHRWQAVRFYERDAADVESHRQYWRTWLAAQITYHVTHTVMNHPFLYMVAAQNNRRLAVTNTFWRRSSQLVLLHATWIVRIAEMVLERRILLSDPIFGQAAAIAATVHLYFLSTDSSRLRQSSAANLAKSRQFLQSFKTCSPLCVALDDRLDKLLEAALGSDWATFETDPPSQISLNARLMWELLELACSNSSVPITGGNGSLHWSLVPADNRHKLDEMVFDIGYEASSVPVDVDTSDGGQSAPIAVVTSVAAVSVQQPGSSDSTTQPLPNNLLTNELGYPWLWDINHSNMSVHSDDFGQAGAAANLENPFWWDFGNL